MRKAICLALALAFACAPAGAADLTVFAASSLSDSLKKIGAAYEKKSGRTVAFSFAASSALARQIEASPGADVFISADEDWMDYLDKKGLIDRATRKDVLGNTLVLIAPASSKLRLSIARKFDLAGALGNGRLAIADPSSVPAGKYAKASLTALGAWNGVSTRLAATENVRVALSYVARGEAPLGIVYATDAAAEPQVRIVGTFPESSHQPIRYPAAATKEAKLPAREFLSFLAGPEARTEFRESGFVVLGR